MSWSEESESGIPDSPERPMSWSEESESGIPDSPERPMSWSEESESGYPRFAWATHGLEPEKGLEPLACALRVRCSAI